jgi:DDE superfamily endonuclease
MNVVDDNNDEDSEDHPLFAVAPEPIENRKRSYTLAYKKSAVSLISILGVKPTASQYNIPLTCLKRWRKQINEIRSLSSDPTVRSDVRRNMIGQGRRSSISTEMAQLLIDFYRTIRDKSLVASLDMMVAKYIQLERQEDPEYELPERSRRPLRRRIWLVLKKNDVVHRCPTHQAQTTRTSDREKSDFVEYINDKMRMLNIDKSAICNFDETNIFFSFKSKTTLNDRGAKTVSVRQAGDTQRCTVMIGVSGSNEKFPPFIIFKGKDTRGGRVNKTIDRIEIQQQASRDGEHDGFPLSNIYTVQEKAWMNTTTMHKWIDTVYAPWARRINGPNIVLLDLGPAHAKTEIVDRIAEFHGHVELLPPHSTPVLQVMDVGINKPFKNAVKNQYDMWFVEHADEGDPKPRRPDVATWIATAWLSIRPQTIERTWRHIGWMFEQNINNMENNNDNDESNNVNNNEDDVEFDINDNDDFMQLRSVVESYASDDDLNSQEEDDFEDYLNSQEEDDFEAQFR